MFKVIGFATKAHDGQRRKGTDEPYICHPLRVAGIMAQEGAPEFVSIAAILHDVVEDTQFSLDDISIFLKSIGVDEDKVDSMIIPIVDALTIKEGEDKLEAIKRLGEIKNSRISFWSMCVKIVDMIDNSQEMTIDKLMRNRERANLLIEMFEKKFPKSCIGFNRLTNILRNRYNGTDTRTTI